MSSPQSAIDEIFNISSSIKDLNSKLEIIEKNIKSLNSKFIILTKKVDSINVDIEKDNSAKKEDLPSANAPDSAKKTKINEEEISDKLVLGSVKTYGYIVNTDRNPIPQVTVSIFDKTESKIRSIKTDSSGYWEARLPSSSYKVIYSHKNFNDVIKNIDIPKGSNNFRVN